MNSNFPPQNPGQQPDPYAAFQAQPPSGTKKPQRSAANLAIFITTSVVGGLVLLGATTSAAIGLAAPDPWQVVDGVSFVEEAADGTIESVAGQELMADADGVTAIEIDAAASSLALDFVDVPEAVLIVKTPGRGASHTGTSIDGWTLERVGDRLVVDRGTASDDAGSMNGRDWQDVGRGWDVKLQLPRQLSDESKVSLRANVTAGDFTSSGSFEDVDLKVQAGDLNFTGDAKSLSLDVKLGDATVEVGNAERLRVKVLTGDATVLASGKAPSDVDIDVKMGALTMQLPSEKYLVQTSRAVGELDNRLEISEDSEHTVAVRMEAAEVVLK